MKTSLKALALVAALSSAISIVHADSLTLTSDPNYSNEVSGGGAYIAKILSGPANNWDYSGPAKIGTDSFLTFCIEKNEGFNSTSTYNYTLINGAMNGGLGGQTSLNYDGVSNATAFLYSVFAQGNLGGVLGFTYDNTATGYSYLQTAIWHLEGELDTGNALSDWVKSYLGADWAADNNGAFGVLALHLTDERQGLVQDQLYFHRVPDQGWTVAFIGLVLLGVASFRKFSFSK
ncbi:MAG: hypothetical protein QM715_10285 [Nibricoccus sp.]